MIIFRLKRRSIAIDCVPAQSSMHSHRDSAILLRPKAHTLSPPPFSPPFSRDFPRGKVKRKNTVARRLHFALWLRGTLSSGARMRGTNLDRLMAGPAYGHDGAS
jgi:hypothetical protein